MGISINIMFELKVTMAINTRRAISGQYGYYGHGHFQYKHDIDWYPLKEHSKTKSVHTWEVLAGNEGAL